MFSSKFSIAFSTYPFMTYPPNVTTNVLLFYFPHPSGARGASILPENSKLVHDTYGDYITVFAAILFIWLGQLRATSHVTVLVLLHGEFICLVSRSFVHYSIDVDNYGLRHTLSLHGELICLVSKLCTLQISTPVSQLFDVLRPSHWHFTKFTWLNFCSKICIIKGVPSLIAEPCRSVKTEYNKSYHNVWCIKVLCNQMHHWQTF